MTTLGRFQAFATDDAGDILPSPTITVHSENGGGLASLFSDRAGAVGITNPFTGGSDGLVAFHVIGGSYKIDIVSGLITRTLRYVPVGTMAENDFPDPSAIAFSATKGGTNQTGVASSTTTQVTWPTEVYDVGSHFASNVWTPPAGKVSLTFGFIADGTIAAGALGNIIITKNGSTTVFKVALSSALNNVHYGLIQVEDVATGSDVYGAAVSLVLSSGTASIRGDITNTFFMGHWIGPT